MKTLIVYFSATGNTKYGVQLIQAGIEKNSENHCDCVEISDFSESSIGDYDLIGFACPVFAYKPTLNMLELIQRLPDGKQKPCFTFVSYGGDLSNTHWIFNDQLKKRNYCVIAQKEMLAQDSWTVIRISGKVAREDEPTLQNQLEIIEFGAGLQEILSKHQSNQLPPVSPEFHFGVYHFISYFYNHSVLDNLFLTRVDPDSCTRCGRCVRSCPTGKMKFEQFPNPQGKCIGCYRCINLCPENAIESWLTNGKSRYKGLDASIKLKTL